MAKERGLRKKSYSSPADLEPIEGVELVVLGVVSGNSERDGIRTGGQLGLQPEDLHPCDGPHVDGVLDDGRDVLVPVLGVQVNVFGDDLEVAGLFRKTQPLVFSISWSIHHIKIKSSILFLYDGSFDIIKPLLSNLSSSAVNKS